MQKQIFKITLLLACLLASGGRLTAETEKSVPLIEITADRLETNDLERFAEFIGNVTARQDETVIKSDRLKIYYKKNAGEKNPEQAIKRLVAKGNVRINFDGRLATCQQATYDAEKRVLVLNGPGSTVRSGKNYVTGEKITIYRETERIMVESGKAKQVKAVFYNEKESQDARSAR